MQIDSPLLVIITLLAFTTKLCFVLEDTIMQVILAPISLLHKPISSVFCSVSGTINTNQILLPETLLTPSFKYFDF